MSTIGNSNIDNLETEKQDDRFGKLDQLSVLELVATMNKADAEVAQVVGAQSADVADAISEISKRFAMGGRIVYVGAGTSGRIATLDASEIYPTFGVADRVLALMAGGRDALVEPREGAEDDQQAGRADAAEIGLSKKDALVGVASSGSTPYVLGALEYANEVGALSVALSCNAGSAMGKISKHKIEVVVGAEVLAGSTRLKAGTAQKMVLNMISTITMVQAGKTYGNLMVDVVASNKKLRRRALTMVRRITDASETEALWALESHDWNVKSAVVGVRLGLDHDKASELLSSSRGILAVALGERT
jgi:N-acetylmuramic acid 6-phosphate etherase